MTALPLTSKINTMAIKITDFRTLTAKFGDGYEQTRPDGINNEVSTWTITYEALTDSEKATVLSFLSLVKGSGIITWTPPGESEKKFKLDIEQPPTQTFKASGITDITMTLREVFA